jgi:hypothetical protein
MLYRQTTYLETSFTKASCPYNVVVEKTTLLSGWFLPCLIAEDLLGYTYTLTLTRMDRLRNPGLFSARSTGAPISLTTPSKDLSTAQLQYESRVL